MKPLLLAPLDTDLSASSQSSTPTTTTPINPSSPRAHPPAPSAGSHGMKRVSFCPLALLIGVAAEGEAEPALVRAAQEQLGKRKVAMCAYSFEAPQIGEVAGKAWHSVLNGFQASLEPFLSGGSGSAGSVCTRSGGRDREHSPERLSGGRRRASSLGSSSRSASSPGRTRHDLRTFDPNDDPSFTPNPTTRLTVKLPALRRECLRSLSTSPTRSILRRCTGDFSLGRPLPGPVSPASPSSSSSSSSADDASKPAPFPPLSPAESAPPPRIASTHAGDDPAAVGALVPLAPCCAACERATHYGLCPPEEAGGSAGYRERWTAGARRKRAEERREREAREKGTGAGAGAGVGVEEGKGDSQQGKGDGEETEEKEAEQAEEEARGSRLGQLAAKGGVDELARERGRRGVPGALADGHHGYDEVEPVALVVAQTHGPAQGSQAMDDAHPPSSEGVVASPSVPDTSLDIVRGGLEEASTPVVVPAGASRVFDPPLAPSRDESAPAVGAAAPTRPPLDSTASGPAALQSNEPPRPTLARTQSVEGPPAAPPAASATGARPPAKRRLSTATASLSRIAVALGQGLLHPGQGAGGSGAGVRA